MECHQPQDFSSEQWRICYKVYRMWWYTLMKYLSLGIVNESHLANLREVLVRLEDTRLRLKKNKCVFMAPSVTYLCHRIDGEGLHPITEKVKAVNDAPNPRNVQKLKSYLGLLNYYGKFLPNLSTELAPLYKLLRAEQKWKWSERNSSFSKIKIC